MLRSLKLALPAAALLVTACLGCGVVKQPIGRLEPAPQDLELGYPEHRMLPMRLHPTAYPIAGGCPTFFVHLTAPDGSLVRTFDHRAPAWPLDEDLAYELVLYQSALAEPLAAGRYRLLAGAYSPELGMRHALEFAGEQAGRGRYQIAAVTVPEPSITWELEFAGGWQEPEAGTDSQVLVRRWFRRRAQLILRDPAVSEPVELRLLLHLPAAASDDDLILDDGEREPRLDVTAACTSYQAWLAPGRRELRFEIPVAGMRQGCTLDLRANYELRSPTLAVPRSASLEAIS